MNTHRTIFLIDGFNLYHSAVDASNALKGSTTKWLNIRSLCESYLPLMGKDYALEQVFYFSALAEHLRAKDPDKVERHLKFIRCLEASGISVELSRFKPKEIWCNNCKSMLIRHEEKETDVALAAKLLELFWQRTDCDTAILVTGDTDIAPAVRTAKKLFPEKKVGFLFPFKRMNKELKQIAEAELCFKISAGAYLRHQFPDPFALSDGTKIEKPANW